MRTRKVDHIPVIIVLIFLVIVAHFPHDALARPKENEVQCDRVILTDDSGQIISPSAFVNNIMTYPSLTNCVWYIKNQPGTTITLRYNTWS